MRPLSLLCVLLAGCLTSEMDVDGGVGGGGGPQAAGGGGGSSAGGGGGGSAGGTAASGGGGAGVVDAGLSGGTYTRAVPGWSGRDYQLLVPPNPSGAALPVILLLHGGGGNPTNAREMTCPTGALTSPECLEALALPRGFLLVAPSGTGAVLRTWNSGGGTDGWQCVSGPACVDGVDELAYFTALLGDLAAVVPVNPHRLYATGLSNGGSMSERLACELPGISAIATIAAANQYATTKPCTKAVSVLEIHGTADPCWPFDGGAVSCADKNLGAKVSVPDTLALWRRNDGCDGGLTTVAVPDTADDGTSTLHHTYACANAALEFYEVRDGGHTWPSGITSANGLTSRDWSANRVLLDFFQAH